jgi:hypothetical protein
VFWRAGGNGNLKEKRFNDSGMLSEIMRFREKRLQSGIESRRRPRGKPKKKERIEVSSQGKH